MSEVAERVSDETMMSTGWIWVIDSGNSQAVP